MKKRPSASDPLRAALQSKRMSQAELARRTGLSAKSVSFLVQGRHGFSPRTAALCQQVLGKDRLARRLLVAQARRAAADAVAHAQVTEQVRT